MPQERWFSVIYPDEYNVPERKVRMWLSDAIANGEIVEQVNPDTVEIEYAIELLQDTGNVTFCHT